VQGSNPTTAYHYLPKQDTSQVLRAHFERETTHGESSNDFVQSGLASLDGLLASLLNVIGSKIPAVPVGVLRISIEQR